MRYGSLRISGSGPTQELPIDQPSLILGRAEGSGLRVDAPTVARRHARLTVEGGYLTVEDLGSATGVWVDGSRIPAATSVRVEPGQALRFGDVEATFTASPTTSPAPTRSPGGQISSPPGRTAARRRLALVLSPPAVALEPGTEAVIEARLSSRSPVIDSVIVEASGLPAGWLREPAPALNLRPGQEAVAHIRVAPPRSPDASAGDHSLTVVARSQAGGVGPSASATVTVTAFAESRCQIRSRGGRGEFALSIANLGNSPATFSLDARDDEGLLDYDFSSPMMTVPPGAEESSDLSVSNPSRGLLGEQRRIPFEVVVRRTDLDVPPKVLQTQFLSTPPLQRYRWPVLILLGLLILFGLAGLVWALTRGGDERAAGGGGATPTSTPSPQSATEATDDDPVHLCASPPGERPPTYTSILPPVGSSEFSGFAQNDPRWGLSEYAHAQSVPAFDIGCGTTLASCGCAVSSMATVMALLGVVMLPNGEGLNPDTLNEWYRQDATLTAGGWVSRGYAFGDVQWDAVSPLSRQLHVLNPTVPRLRFVRWGTGSESEIRAQLLQGRPVILDVTGHFIVATGINEDHSIRIFDPYYADRVTLAAYAGRVRGSRLFEPLDEGGSAQAVVVTVPSTARVRVHEARDPDRAVGTLENVPLEDLAHAIEVTIPGATFDVEEAWRDPTCEFKAPEPRQGVIRIVLPGTSDYVVEVVDPGGATPSWGYHSYDREGRLVDMGAGDGAGTTIAALPGPTETPPTPTSTATPSPTASPRPLPTATPTATATVAPLPTKAPTLTPTVPPLSVFVRCETPGVNDFTCTATPTGKYVELRWYIDENEQVQFRNSTTLFAPIPSATFTVRAEICDGSGFCTSSNIVTGTIR